MKTIKLCGAVFAHKYEWQDEPSYNLFVGTEYNGEKKILEMNAQEYVYICPFELEIEQLSDGQFRARQIQALRNKKEVLRDAFVKESGAVQEKIETLLSIEDQSHEG